MSYKYRWEVLKKFYKDVKIKGEIRMSKNNSIEEILTSVDLLNDKAFKIALDNFNEVFNDLVMFTTGQEVSSSMISAVGSEITLVVKGKSIRIDHLRNTDIGYYNFEGQNDQYKFSIKRQLFHWAAIFASQLQEGDEFEDVMPVAVVVFYKDRGKVKPLIQSDCNRRFTRE